MRVLGIETSCDETAVSVVEDGRRILSNVIASQVEMHARYGGVVPEVASRQHVLEMVPALEEALGRAGLDWGGLDAIAVTNGPGLAGALLVGVNTAKALALSTGLPLMGINHLEGHVYANWLEDADPESECGFPLMCLIASGGHTDLLLMEDHGRYTLLGRTRDDAAGEAFDKAARILGLGFPGGPEVQRAAQDATGEMSLPRAWMRGTHDFSFSGLKTAILHAARKEGIYPPQEDTPPDARLVREMAYAFQMSVADVMAVKTLEAAHKHGARGVMLGGGVAANAMLRQVLREKSTLPVFIPSPRLCTDNGAMIASCAYFRSSQGVGDGWDMDVYPSLHLG
ncbi:MAG: tRNA (adenosine(37)-N6)-threonylcarbamoyltransferase complex transferase subunit TsaD [Chloroflexota bacterium]|nr:tRNA (adenosine(37)-N6)-threonylcarbamoyltransferase complex transferase subunit TsaD [Chloroflexota bacterium]MDE2942556.1 tRNA (adenosine(37)-N6)-threonylcarbamoyltransferase complex transferase subunit TsaD [Chloroflexota bacterium]MDE3268557.1 tRNA (adenosine(37)-N6)-threonylcarbamoyltransferase complex transferase subunit TsaD [Chloroflexota bacterium]